MATASLNKVLVYIRTSKQVPLVQAAFNSCIIDQLLIGDKKTFSCKVKCYLENNNLILEDASSEDSQDDQIDRCVLKHPPFCPLVEISDEDRNSLPVEVLSRGVDVGVAVILESSDNKILLTRRASHMRTFPGVWVPPGGHIELNESLEEAGLRELCEETGLLILPSVKKRSTILALWESVFPPILPYGLPSRHHIVVYWVVQVDRKSSEMEEDIKLNPDEVDASFWLPLELAESVITGISFSMETIKNLQLTLVDKNGEHTHTGLDPKFLLNNMPPPDADIERVTTGSRFAIEMWSKLKKNISDTRQTQRSNL